MAKILIAYASGLGQTALIAGRVGQVLEKLGHKAVLSDVGANPWPDVASHDAVLIAAPVRYSKHHQAVIAFCREQAAALRSRPSAFLAISLSAASVKPGGRREVAKAIAHFIKHTAWVPPRIEPVAGALAYTKYGFVIKRVIKLIAGFGGHSQDTSRDHEYTDWERVEAFARSFSASLPGVAGVRSAA